MTTMICREKCISHKNQEITLNRVLQRLGGGMLSSAESLARPPGPGARPTIRVSEEERPLAARLREMAASYLRLGQAQSALYWADKLASLNGSRPGDLHLLADCLLAADQPHRAAHLVRSRGLHTAHLGCCLVAATALQAAGEPGEALALLEEGEQLLKEEEVRGPHRGEASRWVAPTYLLKGRVLEALDSRQLVYTLYSTH
jgi:hypothetical protein